MARDAKVLRVTLEAIECTSVGDDPGDTLEIWGNLDARGVTIDQFAQPQIGFQQNLWQRAENNELPIAAQTQFLITENNVAQFLVFDRDFLWLGGKIVDNDFGFNPDDVLGDGFAIIRYENIRDGIVPVTFNGGSDQEVVARYNVKILTIEHHPEL